MYAPNEVVQCSGNSTFNAESSGSIVDHFGILGSSKYTNNASCGWLIDVSRINPKDRVQLTFNLFSLNDTDSLSVYDGSSSAAPLIATLKGFTLPPSLTSTGSTIYLVFQTNDHGVALGFEAGFNVIGQAQFCSGSNSITSTSGTIQDHSGGGNYQKYVQLRIPQCNNFRFLAMQIVLG